MHARRLCFGIVCGIWLLTACGERDRPAVPQVAQRARPALRLAALTDISGYLEPCGCQSKPLGGIDRAASKLQALRADHVPLVFLATGDLLFGDRPEGAASSTEAAAQETWKAETLIDIFNRLGLSAATPGKRDLSFGPAELERLEGLSKFAWLPAKPGSGAEKEAVARWLGQAGEIKVGVVGVSTFEGPEAGLPTERLQALSARTQAEIEKLRADGARLVIALISSDQRTGRRLSAGLHGLDFTLQGGLDDASAPPPTAAGNSAWLRAGRQGQGLLVVDVYLDTSAKAAQFVDISEWTQREQRTALQTRVSDLAQRVQAWERDPAVDRASVNEQRNKLESLRAELERAQKPPSAQGNAFNARYEAITHEQSSDNQIASVVDAYDARVNEHNRVAFADVKPAEPAPGAPHYVGSATCQGCHAAAYTWWTGHPHGNAYKTLENVHKQFNFSCVACHVTGYGKPGGSTLVHNQGLINVGCESCHGPASQHITQPTVTSALTRSPAESVCKQCHTPEHSDLFEFKSFSARLRVKGHGLPMTATD